jgi:hypothetical protein
MSSHSKMNVGTCITFIHSYLNLYFIEGSGGAAEYVVQSLRYGGEPEGVVYTGVIPLHAWSTHPFYACTLPRVVFCVTGQTRVSVEVRS